MRISERLRDVEDKLSQTHGPRYVLCFVSEKGEFKQNGNKFKLPLDFDNKQDFLIKMSDALRIET